MGRDEPRPETRGSTPSAHAGVAPTLCACPRRAAAREGGCCPRRPAWHPSHSGSASANSPPRSGAVVESVRGRRLVADRPRPAVGEGCRDRAVRHGRQGRAAHRHRDRARGGRRRGGRARGTASAVGTRAGGAHRRGRRGGGDDPRQRLDARLRAVGRRGDRGDARTAVPRAAPAGRGCRAGAGFGRGCRAPFRCLRRRRVPTTREPSPRPMRRAPAAPRGRPPPLPRVGGRRRRDRRARRARRIRPAGGHARGHRRSATRSRFRRRRRRRPSRRRPSSDIDGLTPGRHPERRVLPHRHGAAVPAVDPSTWSLRIHGMVDQEVTLTWDELLALPLDESVTTLTCVSNEVGGDLIGNAVWLGYPIRELLARAAPTADADMVLSRSVDGFTASTPLAVLQDDRNAILAVGMNGEPLPPSTASRCAWWCRDSTATSRPRSGWSISRSPGSTRHRVLDGSRLERARTDQDLQSRIDVPRRASRSRPARRVAGVAWHQHVGIAGVEVQVDDGAVAARRPSRPRSPTTPGCSGATTGGCPVGNAHAAGARDRRRRRGADLRRAGPRARRLHRPGRAHRRRDLTGRRPTHHR